MKSLACFVLLSFIISVYGEISITILEEYIISIRQDMIQMKADMQKMMNTSSASVPVGFVYVQLHGQSDPKTLWPGSMWSDVTSSYAGLFFRAEGGTSALFGQVQAESSPMLTEIVSDINVPNGRWSLDFSTVKKGMFSDFIYSGAKAAKDPMFLKFKMSADEVKPRNAAIRVWRRTA